jgi:hypothetical protein
MDFMQGEKAKREDGITLLCWMVGDQLDTTMSSQTSEMTKSQPKKPASRSDTSHPDSAHSDSN